MRAAPNCFRLDEMGEKLSFLRGIGDKKLADARLSAVCIHKATDGAKLHIMSQLPVRRLIVASDTIAAKNICRRLSGWGVRVVYLPHRDDVLLVRRGVTQAGMYARMLALRDIAFDLCDAVVVSAEALLQKFPAKELVRRFSVQLAKGTIVSPQSVAEALAMGGYKRREMVSDIGEFALRGDILDVFSPDGNAYRVNFFDELIEDIKIIDIESMLSSNEAETIILPPVSDILLDEEGLARTSERLQRIINVKNAPNAKAGLYVGACDPMSVWALPFMDENSEPLLDFFDDDRPTLIAFDEPKVIFEKLTLISKEFDSRTKGLLDAGEITREHRELYITVDAFKRRLAFIRKLSFCSFTLSNALFEPKCIIDVNCKPVTKYYLDPPSIAQDIRGFVMNGMKVILATGDRERAKNVIESLRDLDVASGYGETGDSEFSVEVTPLEIELGVIYPSQKKVLIGMSECIGKHKGESVISPKTQFIAPKAGDYVVHRAHGIGLCEGTTVMKTGEYEREYIVIRYRDGDTLYVATDQMNNLQKFVGEENPTLNKLGGKEFEREKEKVRKSVRRMALNLVEIYAKRQKQRGFRYGADTVWQHEFEDAFEYEETADQLKAISDVKRDMEEGKVMDRLIVGDVGFGKTEVAFRAMFKTVLDSKQAVLIAPTTILARQHYENLVPRLAPFGIRCGLLTRLQSAKDNEKLIQDIKSGYVHMVVATHKVLSKDVEFADLGLMVLDEEQRFGVEHKEKLKEKYPLVNVLTLSATPIPRTLNMSLTGIRDISMLETPPQGRLPVQTYVTPFSDALVQDAVNREVARGGQTLILCNDIETLSPFADKVRALCEGARVITAHGQMPSGMLESRIAAFYDRQFDVLIATTIIENGIDLPDANTLIVIDSENFGLAQLYQLRGRVGRRGALAHAYFTVPSEEPISENAEKRLNTLLENTDIGSGFRVALADLSIRGAGNLLGAEQSGHIEKVGYEMYLELLDEAVREIRTGEKVKPLRDVEMRVDVRAFISDGYVSNRDKIRVYKRIADVATFAARDALIEELDEVYGPPDSALINLIDISLLKNLVARYDASRVTINRKGAGVNFYDADVFKNEPLMKAVADYDGKAMLTSTIPPTLLFEYGDMPADEKLKRMIEFFGNI